MNVRLFKPKMNSVSTFNKEGIAIKDIKNIKGTDGILVTYKDNSKTIFRNYNYFINKVGHKEIYNPKVLKSIDALVESTDINVGDIIYYNNDFAIVNKIENGLIYSTLNSINDPDPFKDGSCIATYTFDDETAKDLSGRYNGTWGGKEQYSNDKFGGRAANMINASASTYIKTPIIDKQGSKEITITGWINVLNNTRNWVSIWHLTPDDSNNYRGNNSRQPALWLYRDDNTKFHIRSDGVKHGNLGIYKSNGSITYNKWHFITQVVALRQMKFYIDGKLTDTYNSNEDFAFNNGYFYIGDRWYIKNHLIDQVRIFNKALTEEEINALYKEQNLVIKGPVKKLVL